jgi:5-oxoprolinase (ATP-hydrolysing)
VIHTAHALKWEITDVSRSPDRGGTFTDVWASVSGRDDVVLKLLSEDPENYNDAPAEGIRRVLEMVSGDPIPRRSPIPKGLIHSIRMGTTVATNGKLSNVFSFVQ